MTKANRIVMKRILYVIFIVQTVIAKGQVPEYIPEASYLEIEDRLKCLNAEMPLHFNRNVKQFVEYFTIRNRPYTKKIIGRADLFFPIFDHYLSKYELPKELRYLAIVESGLNPFAVSRAGAVGLWQFMPSTGRDFKLKQTWYIDERVDPYEATEKACIYLKRLHRTFNDWSLALAAYNSGPGNVRKAIRRAGGHGSFWDIYRHLPRETRSYVPQFVAVTYTMNYTEEHNLPRPPKMYPIVFDTIHVSGYMHLETFANQINVCVDDMIALNPHLVRGAIPSTAWKFPLRVPSDKYDEILSYKKELIDSASRVGRHELQRLAKNEPGSTFGRERIIYRVRSGDVLGIIAQRYHVRVSDIRIWNNMRGSMIRVGQKLKIYVLPAYNSSTRNVYAGTSSKNTKANKLVSKSLNESKYHTVQFGDSLWDISKLYANLSVEKLKKWNNLTSNKIKPGQKLIIAL